jgi:hypothetical protein
VDGISSFPQRVSHPSKDSPRPQPHRVTTAVAFLTFHSLQTLPSRLRRAVLPVNTSSLVLRRVQVSAFPATEAASHTDQSVLFLKSRPKPFSQVSFSPLPKKRHNRSASRSRLGAYRPSVPKNQPSIRARPSSEESCRAWSTLSPAVRPRFLKTAVLRHPKISTFRMTAVFLSKEGSNGPKPE